MKKIILSSIFFIGLCIPTISYADSLQEKINNAQPYDVIDLKTSEYTTPIVISKPLTIKGGVFRVKDISPVITIRSDDVTVDSVFIIDATTNTGASIDSMGKNTTLTQNTIHTNRIGIAITESTNTHINNNTIIGTPKSNGIHMTKSKNAVLLNNHTSKTKDGMYIEYCSNFLLENNNIQQGRYGVHIMFGDSHQLRSNTTHNNVIGFMIMSTKGIKVSKNIIKNQLNSVNGSGITIFDVTDCAVMNNKIQNNRYGVILQNAQHNKLNNNLFSQNIVAMQFLQANNNTFTSNRFIGNAVSGENWGSVENQITHNYWDNATAIDWNGDNKSDTPYHLQSFFIRLQRLNEGYSLLFDQPGLSVLETLMPPSKESALTDKAPLISSPLSSNTKGEIPSIPWFSIVIIVVLSYLWYIGRRISK